VLQPGKHPIDVVGGDLRGCGEPLIGSLFGGRAHEFTERRSAQDGRGPEPAGRGGGHNHPCRQSGALWPRVDPACADVSGAVSHMRGLGGALAHAREAIAFVLAVPEDSFELRLEPALAPDNPAAAGCE